MERKSEQDKKKPEKVRQKAVAPLKIGGEIRAKKIICHFDYYLKDSGGKWQPRLYLCEHRTLADIFLEAALFDPKKNVLCIPKAEWESAPEEARQSLRKFKKIFREPYQTSHGFVRQLFCAQQEGRSILLPVTEDARGMDRGSRPDTRAIARLCLQLEMPVCTVTFREEQGAENSSAAGQDPEADSRKKQATGSGSAEDYTGETGGRGERNCFFMDVKPLLSLEKLKETPENELGSAVSDLFETEVDSHRNEDFLEKKRLMMRQFLKSELYVQTPVEICQCHSCGLPDEKRGGRVPDNRNNGREKTEDSALAACAAGGLLRADMTGITLETAGNCYHRAPGALKSLAVYPAKKPETGEKGTMVIFPHYDKAFYLFTDHKEHAENIQAAAEQMYEIVSTQ